MNEFEEEARAFDDRINERAEHGFIPDLRRLKPNDYFYKSFWSHPHYADLYVGTMFRNYLAFLKKLILCKNTIGKLGISSVLRALDHVFQDHTRHDLVIDLEDTASDIQESFSGGSQKLAQFDFTEPAGSYELFLDRPEEYALACEILRVANSRTG